MLMCSLDARCSPAPTQFIISGLLSFIKFSRAPYPAVLCKISLPAEMTKAPHAMSRKGDGRSGGRCTPFFSILSFLSQLKSQIRTCSNSNQTNRVNVRDTFDPVSARQKSSTVAFYWLSCLQKLLFICLLLPTIAKPKQLQLLLHLQKQSSGWGLDSIPHGQNCQMKLHRGC